MNSNVQVIIKENPFIFQMFIPGQPIGYRAVGGTKGTTSHEWYHREKLFQGLKFKKYWDRPPIERGVALHLEFRIKPTRALQNQYGQLLEGQDCIRIPNLDKYIKFITEVLTPIAWSNESQITVLKARKFYSYEPGTDITIYESPTP